MKETEEQRRQMQRSGRRRRRPQHANREVLRRFRNSVIAFFVIALLIVIVIWVAFGKGIRQAKESGEKFGVQWMLAALYPEKYSYSTEMANLQEYFKLDYPEDIAIILQDDRINAKGKLYDGTVYFSIDTVRDLFTDRFYVNSEENILLYTTASEVIRVDIGDDSKAYYTGETATPTDYAIARYGKDGTLYVAADYVKKYANFTYDFYADPNRMQVYNSWGMDKMAEVTDDTHVRYQGGIKSDILCEIAKGSEVEVLEGMENWTKVKTADGYIGYIENARLGEVVEVKADPATGAYDPKSDYAMVPPQERVLLGWHQIFSPDDGTGMSEITAGATGMNVVSPTWFFLKGTNDAGEVDYTCIASAKYVERAHEKGYQVWALVENMENDFDEYALFSSSANRAALIDKLLADAETYGFDGINMDIELTDSKLNKVGPHYVQFLRELSIQTHAKGLILSVDVNVPTESNREINLKEQGLVNDYVIMMGYDEHYIGSDAGSIASVTFVEKGLEDMKKQGVPVDKIVCAVPFYTRIWRTDRGNVTSDAVGMDTAMEWVNNRSLPIEWDEDACCNYAEKSDGDVLYQVWIEDEDSTEARLGIISAQGVRSIAGWKLGLENANTWNIIDSMIE